MSPTSRFYRSQTTSPYKLHRRWIQQDMDLNDSNEMRAYDLAQYRSEQDGLQTGTDGNSYGG